MLLNIPPYKNCRKKFLSNYVKKNFPVRRKFANANFQVENFLVIVKEFRQFFYSLPASGMADDFSLPSFLLVVQKKAVNYS